MVAITNITTTIDELDALYDANPTQATYFSKLALIELCGWIEQTMDSVIKDHSTGKIIEADNINYLDKQIIKRTFGFHYEDNFRLMLMKLVGLITLEQIEIKLTVTGDLPVLSSQLEILKKKRNDAAHTAITGVTLNYDAPSIVKGYLNTIHPILSKIENELINTTVLATSTSSTVPRPPNGCSAILATIIFAGLILVSRSAGMFSMLNKGAEVVRVSSEG